MGIAVATAGGLHLDGTGLALEGRDVTDLSVGPGGWWALVDGRSLLRSQDGGSWEEAASVPKGLTGRCVLSSPHGVLVGTSEARLLRLEEDDLVPVPGFDQAPGREGWYTPWGGPPDTRSLAADSAGLLFVNVHVGGVLRSQDGGISWVQTIDIDADVHEVLAHPGRPGVVMAAAGVGFALSIDAGGSWAVDNEGLRATYCRAVAVAGEHGETVVVSASRGPGGGQAAVYRRGLEGAVWERCGEGLPEQLEGNVDTHCLAAGGPVVAIGTPHGSVFVSRDAGITWEEAESRYPPIRRVLVL